MTELHTMLSQSKTNCGRYNQGIALQFLEITLDIIAREGTYKVTLSNVAKATGVNPRLIDCIYESADELTEKSFVHFAQHRRSAIDAFWAEVDNRQSRLVVGALDNDQEAQHLLCEWVTFFHSNLSRLITQNSQELIIEMTLLLTQPEIQPAQDIMQQIYRALYGLCRGLNQPDSEAKAQKLLKAILSLTYAEVGKDFGCINSERLQTELRQLFRPLFFAT